MVGKLFRQTFNSLKVDCCFSTFLIPTAQGEEAFIRILQASTSRSQLECIVECTHLSETHSRGDSLTIHGST